MIDERVIYRIEQEKSLERSRGDLNNALQSVKSAIHYLEETHRYESDLLDDITDQLMTIEENLMGLLRS